MNEFLRIGDRIRLLEMPNDPNPIPKGAIGTVISISHHDEDEDIWHQVDVKWDNGRSLMLTLPQDRIEILEEAR